MALPGMATKPHAPTLVYSIVLIVVVIFLYHVVAGKRRRG
jgi:hypothetical protein